MVIERPVEITIEDWEKTPSAVQEYIAKQEAELQDARERLGQNSQNSSRPPSSDFPEQKGKKSNKERKANRRKAGGQPGHKRHKRELKPVEEVDDVVPVKPESCRHCGAELEGEDNQPHRHQVTEIPPIEPTVTEYQLHTLCCGQCGGKTRAKLPAGVPRRAFGARLQSIVSMASGVYRMSRRQVEEMMSDFFKVELSLGTVKNLEEDTSEALTGPVEEAKAYVKEQKQANIDETSWKQGTEKGWLWVMVTQWVAVFVIRLSRGSKVAKELLGEDFKGVVNSDRYSAYNWLPVKLRQLCWAHLLRQFQAYVDYGGQSAQIGQALLTETELMFAWWYKLRQGEISRTEFQEIMKPIRAEIVRLLKKGAAGAHQKTAGSCAHILKFKPALWTFIEKEGIEPTNNEAEREIRSGVIWRKTSFGSQSEAGSIFVERMLTVSATLKRQNRNVLDYLTEACTARLHNRPAPSLLPQE
jgi:transposase